MKKEIIEWIKSLLFALVLALAISYFVSGTRVQGASMEPTLEHEDVLLMFRNKNIKHGDIVILRTGLEIRPEELEAMNFINRLKVGKTKSLVKRVIAKEGDRIEILDGQVFLNGDKLEEEYINGFSTLGQVEIGEIPKNKVFVLGDNRGNSLDSRNQEIGLVDIKDIRGKAILRLYPFGKAGRLN